MVEFVVGIIAVLILFAGLMQIASLTKTHTDTMVEARRLAAEQAVIDMDTLSPSEYILQWRNGADGKPYTRDDEYGNADPGAFGERMVERASATAAGWDVIDLAPNDDISYLHNNPDPSSSFGLVKGSAHGTVDLLPAFQKFIYAAPRIDVGCDVWMTQTKGLY